MESYPNDDTLFETPAAARYIGSSVPTLVRWRQIGEGPAFIKSGRAVKYRKSALDRYLDDCTRRPHRRPRLSKVEAVQ